MPKQKPSLMDVISKPRSQNFRKLLYQWNVALRKEIYNFAKKDCKKWFGVSMKSASIPFGIFYDKTDRELRIFGEPPNKNVTGEYSRRQRRVKLKPNERKPVYIPFYVVKDRSEKAPKQSTWFVPKYKYSGLGKDEFVTGSAYTSYSSSEHKGFSKLSTTKFKKPVLWSLKPDRKHVFFVRQDESLSDKIMQSGMMKTLVRNGFDKAMKKLKFTDVSEEDINKILQPLVR